MSCNCKFPTRYSSNLVTTRKRHKCVECGNFIKAKEKAEKVDALYNNNLQTFYTCLECQEIIEFIRHRQDNEDELFNELHEALCCHGELYDLLYELCFDDREEENEGPACHYLLDVSWLNPVAKGKLSLKIEAKQ